MYVTIHLLFDNIGGILTFVGFEVHVCLSHAAIPCSYRILCLGHPKPQNGKKKKTKMFVRISFLMLALGG